MAYAIFEGTISSVEGIIFPKILEKYRDVLREDAIVIVKARISTRDDSPPQLICDEIHHISEYEHIDTAEETNKKLYLRIKDEDCDNARAVRAIISALPGKLETILYFESTKKKLRTYISEDVAVYTRLREILGADNVVLK